MIKESRSPQSVLCLIAAGTGIAHPARAHKSRATEGLVFGKLIPPMRPLQYGMAWRGDDDSPIVANFLAVATTLYSGTA